MQFIRTTRVDRKQDDLCLDAQDIGRISNIQVAGHQFNLKNCLNDAEEVIQEKLDQLFREIAIHLGKNNLTAQTLYIDFLKRELFGKDRPAFFSTQANLQGLLRPKYTLRSIKRWTVFAIEEDGSITFIVPTIASPDNIEPLPASDFNNEQFAAERVNLREYFRIKPPCEETPAQCEIEHRVDFVNFAQNFTDWGDIQQRLMVRGFQVEDIFHVEHMGTTLTEYARQLFTTKDKLKEHANRLRNYVLNNILCFDENYACYAAEWGELTARVDILEQWINVMTVCYRRNDYYTAYIIYEALANLIDNKLHAISCLSPTAQKALIDFKKQVIEPLSDREKCTAFIDVMENCWIPPLPLLVDNLDTVVNVNLENEQKDEDAQQQRQLSLQALTLLDSDIIDQIERQPEQPVESVQMITQANQQDESFAARFEYIYNNGWYCKIPIFGRLCAVIKAVFTTDNFFAPVAPELKPSLLTVQEPPPAVSSSHEISRSAEQDFKHANPPSRRASLASTVTSTPPTRSLTSSPTSSLSSDDDDEEVKFFSPPTSIGETLLGRTKSASLPPPMDFILPASPRGLVIG